jgi:hypothetical protein
MLKVILRGLLPAVTGYALAWMLIYHPIHLRANQTDDWTWNINTGGNDANGCAYVGFQTSSAVNYSLLAKPHLTIVASGPTTGQATATVNGSTVTFTAGSYTPVAADVNNAIQIPAGITGVTAGMYAVTATTSTTWTLDRATGAASATAITGAVAGGACYHVGPVTSLITSTANGPRIYVQAGTYTYTGPQTLACLNSFPTSSPRLIEGYNTVQGDLIAPSSTLARPVIDFTGRTDGFDIGTTAQCGWYISSLVLDGQSGTGLYGIHSEVPMDMRWLEIRNFSNPCIYSTYNNFGNGARTTAPIHVWASYIHGCDMSGTGGGQISVGPEGISMEYSRVDAIGTMSAQPNIFINGGGVSTPSLFHHSIISNASSAGQDGILTTSAANGIVAYNNIFYNLGRDGIRAAGSAVTTAAVYSRVQCNIFDTNRGTALDLVFNSGFSTSPLIQYHPNAYYQNGANGANIIISPAYYDVLLTVDPFVAAASNNFALNGLSPGGAQLKFACLSKGISLGGSAVSAPTGRSYGPIDP